MDTGTRQRLPLAAILELANRQHDLITLAQLRAAGLSAEAIKHRRRNGRLHEIWPRVYAVGRPSLTRSGRWMAAVLACGPGAALGERYAGALWQVWERALPPKPHVCVPTRAGRRSPAGIVLHRTKLPPGDVTLRDSIPVTTLERTLVDLTAVAGPTQLKSALRQAERLHRLDLRGLRERIRDAPARSVKHARLRRTLDAYVTGAAATEADAEMAFLEICASHRLPRPECQVRVGRYRADFLWRDLDLVVEIDDRQSHDGYVAFRDDRVRDRTLKAAGLEVERFTRIEVLHDGAVVGRELRAILARRRAR